LSLKQKTITGLSWSFIDSFANLGITFIVGIILARLLEPREFGLVGMTTIFIAISQSFIDSGFTQALIRKQNCTQTDYSTVFFFNLAVGILFFMLLLITAPLISSFFDEPQLTLIVQVLSLGLIISALTIGQRARLTKEIGLSPAAIIYCVNKKVKWFAVHNHFPLKFIAKDLTVPDESLASKLFNGSSTITEKRLVRAIAWFKGQYNCKSSTYLFEQCISMPNYNAVMVLLTPSEFF